MARSKKSRKVGLIGVRKDPDFKPSENRKSDSPRPKKHKGKPAGNRHNVEQKKVTGKKSAENKDPHHGSKKPIQLVKSVTPTPVQKKKLQLLLMVNQLYESEIKLYALFTAKQK